MRLLLVLVAILASLSAQADVSDSGNLSIGGNGVIVGSMTVIGPIAASSVTLSSSGAGAYDLTTATGIHVLSGAITLESGSYVLWADGSTSTTAVSRVSGASLAGYSSGTANSFSLVLVASVTYTLNFSITVTSGSSTNASPFICTINANATASNYDSKGMAYPNPYNFHADGSLAYWQISNCGTGAVNSGDFESAVMKIGSIPGLSNRLAFTGTFYETCQSQLFTASNTFQFGGAFKGAGPWTLKCYPLGGIGWQYEAALYQPGF